MRTKLHDELAATVEEVYKLWCNSAQAPSRSTVSG